MKVKPSTVAMGVVTAGVFAVALWRTQRGGASPDARSCEQRHPERARELAAFAEKKAQVARVVGDNLTAGPLFGGIEVGSVATYVVRNQAAARAADAGFALSFETAGDNVIDAMHMTVASVPVANAVACIPSPTDACSCYGAIDEGELCNEVGRLVAGRWGTGSAYGADRVWLFPEDQRRASVHGCTVTIERAVAPAVWIGKSLPAVIPIDAIGTSVKRLGPRANELRSQYELRWTGPGVGIGTGQTQITGYLDEAEPDILLGIRATGEVASGAMYDELQQQISKVAGSIPTPIGRLLTWPGKVPITLSWDPGAHGQHVAAFTLSVGSAATVTMQLADPRR